MLEIVNIREYGLELEIDNIRDYCLELEMGNIRDYGPDLEIDNIVCAELCHQLVVAVYRVSGVDSNVAILQ